MLVGFVRRLFPCNLCGQVHHLPVLWLSVCNNMNNFPFLNQRMISHQLPKCCPVLRSLFPSVQHFWTVLDHQMIRAASATSGPVRTAARLQGSVLSRRLEYILAVLHTVGTESIQTPLNFSLFVILQPFAKII